MCKSEFLVRKMLEADEKMAAKVVEVEVAGLREDRDIPYVDDGNVYHLLDVIRPEGEGKLPVLIDVHGGSWIFGTKDINVNFCRNVAAKGYCVVNISYRLIKEGGGGTFPNILNDVFDAFNWVEKNIERYGGDLNNMFLSGDSAGAHLACLCAAINGDERLGSELNMKSGLKLRALGLNCPVANIDRFRKIKLPIVSYMFKLFFGAEGKKHRYSRLVSLQNAPLDKLPPTFLISSYADFLRRDMRFLEGELVKRGIETARYYPEKQRENKLTHVYSVIHPDWAESQEANEAMLAFFAAHLAD